MESERGGREDIEQGRRDRGEKRAANSMNDRAFSQRINRVSKRLVSCLLLLRTEGRKDGGRKEEELEMRQLNWWKSWRVSPSNILVALNTFLVGQGGQGGGGNYLRRWGIC